MEGLRSIRNRDLGSSENRSSQLLDVSLSLFLEVEEELGFFCEITLRRRAPF